MRRTLMLATTLLLVAGPTAVRLAAIAAPGGLAGTAARTATIRPAPVALFWRIAATFLPSTLSHE